jgi:hypothetical protein
MKRLSLTSFLIGLILAGASIFAEQIGMDNDAGWGPGRILIFKAGIGLISLAFLLYIFRNMLSRLGFKILTLVARFKNIEYSRRMVIFSVPAVLIVISSYLWFILPVLKAPDFNHYTLLARAFKKHQLHLIEEPPPALLALDDPYNFTLRKESKVEDFPWDASLYNGKFYFYWGPAPSLLLSFLSNEVLDQVKDVHLVFSFTCGLFFYSVFFTYSIWLRLNKSLPPWLFGVAILAIGLSAPIARLLVSARVYEAAITGCQFFFIGGLYWIYSALKGERPGYYKFLLAGMHWALALGTRITISPVILFATIMALLYILRHPNVVSLKSRLLMTLYLCLPMVVATAGLAWYNWARFGSVSEFGITYQLANVDYRTFKDSFSIAYIKQNLYNYFVHPLKIRQTFPFLEPIENTFTNERLAGLVYISPYFLLAVLFVLRFLRKENLPGSHSPDAIGNWLLLTLAGSSIIATLLILSFYFPTARYSTDFMPSLLLLSTASLGESFRIVGKNKFIGNLYLFLVTLLAIYSVIASSLVALPIYGVKRGLLLIKEISKLLGF